MMCHVKITVITSSICCYSELLPIQNRRIHSGRLHHGQDCLATQSSTNT